MDWAALSLTLWLATLNALIFFAPGAPLAYSALAFALVGQVSDRSGCRLAAGHAANSFGLLSAVEHGAP